MKIKWPNKLGGYSLKEKADLEAIYEETVGCGFTNRLYIALSTVEHNGIRPVEVKRLQNNGWGKDRWFVLGHEFWRSIDEYFGSYSDMTYIPNGKRKPRPVEPMPTKEFKEWCDTLPEQDGKKSRRITEESQT